jgi:hypothetical protein
MPVTRVLAVAGQSRRGECSRQDRGDGQDLRRRHRTLSIASRRQIRDVAGRSRTCASVAWQYEIRSLRTQDSGGEDAGCQDAALLADVTPTVSAGEQRADARR